jgi:hypothetical protein
VLVLKLKRMMPCNSRGQQALYSDLMQIARSMRREHGATIAVSGHQSTALKRKLSSRKTEGFALIMLNGGGKSGMF